MLKLLSTKSLHFMFKSIEVANVAGSCEDGNGAINELQFAGASTIEFSFVRQGEGVQNGSGHQLPEITA